MGNQEQQSRGAVELQHREERPPPATPAAAASGNGTAMEAPASKANDREWEGDRYPVRRWVMPAVVLLVTLVQGFLYLLLLPPWQHYDEPTHFEYVWLTANHPGLPDESSIDHRMRREVAASMYRHDFFHNLPPPDLLTDDRRIWLGILELGHPPAYYLLVSLPLRLVSHLDMTSQLYVARSVSVLLFFLTVLITAGVARELTPAGHRLRCLLPLSVTMLPPFVNQMTAVNNDVGAVFTVSLFLWGAVRTIRLGPSLARLLWLLAASLLAVSTKNTAAITLLLIPLVLLLAIWVQREWRWRSLVYGLLTLTALAVISLFSWGDAAGWYRVMRTGIQEESTRQAVTKAPSGSHALMLTISPDGSRRLMSPLSSESVRKVAGKTVTVGAWVWADREVRLPSPGLAVGLKGQTGLSELTQPVDVTSTPTFVSHRVTIPDKAGEVYYTVFGPPRPGETEPVHYFADNAFVITGTLPAAGIPVVKGNRVIIDGREWENFVRNPGAERATIRLRSTIDRLMKDYARRSLDVLLSVLLDFEHSGPRIARFIIPHLVKDFFQAFAWGHVRLSGPFWNLIVYIVFGGAIAGTVVWLARGSGAAAPYQQASILLLALVGIGIWAAAIVWPLPYLVAKVILPSSRYTFPAILPMALLLVGGWSGLFPERYRQPGLLLFFALLLLLNLAAIRTIWWYYASVPGN